jgi:hypothetical protein
MTTRRLRRRRQHSFRGWRGIPIASVVGTEAFSAEAIALFAEMEVQPDAARKIVIDTCIKALISSGVWSLLDVLYVFAAHTEQAALLNWKNPGTFDATSVSGTAFTEDVGFTGDASADYLETGFNPFSAGGNYTQNSASFGARTTTDRNDNENKCLMGWVAGAAVSILRTDSATGFGTMNINSSGANIAGAATGLGWWAVTTESDPAVQTVYKDGAEFDSGSRTSAAIADGDTFQVLAIADSNYSDEVVNSAFIGGQLSETLMAAFHTAELAYMQAVGAV